MKKAGVSSILFVVILLAVAVIAEAQQTRSVTRIGYLSSVNPANESARAEGIRLALRERGYIEGQNIAIEYRYGEGKIDRYPELANELVRLKNDIIVVAGGIHLIRAAKNATKTIPIVMVGAGNDPVEAGLIESLARPGANVTGLTNLVGKLGGKRLELLKEAVPKACPCRGYLRAGHSSQCSRGERRPSKRGPHPKVGCSNLGGTRCGRFRHGICCAKQAAPGGLYVAGSPLINANQKRIADFALKSRLPSVYGDPGGIEAGALMYYGADLADSYRRVAYYVDRILKGAKPADLPVEQPTKFELVINLKTAKQIGLTIPPEPVSAGYENHSLGVRRKARAKWREGKP